MKRTVFLSRLDGRGDVSARAKVWEKSFADKPEHFGENEAIFHTAPGADLNARRMGSITMPFFAA